MTVIELLKGFGFEIELNATKEYVSYINKDNVIALLLEKEVSIPADSFYTGARDPKIPDFDEDDDCWYI